MQMQKKKPARGPAFQQAVLESGQVALDQNGHVGHDVGVQSDLDRVLADGLQVAVGQADLGLFDREVSLLQTFGDVAVGHGTEQTAVDASLLDDLQLVAVQALAQGLGSGQLLGLQLFQFSAAGFEFLQGGVGGTTGLLLGIRKLRA